MRIGHAVQDQQERLGVRREQIRQIVFAILTPRLHARHDALMHRAIRFFIQPLAVCHLHRHALRFQRVDQRQQTFVFTPFKNKHFLKALGRAFQQGLHRVDAVNHFTHEWYSLWAASRPVLGNT
ncbi:hypothetical protein BN132_1918 [Cronobacter turicensis 564]|nr:hypothetical protein BN132_1918 [Cronobacter turicensis 564]